MFIPKKLFSYNKLIGSSLSETLIVMAVLGIVFTLSMGIIVADYNKTQTVIRLKKIYTVLDNVFRASSVLNSAPVNWEFPEQLKEQSSYLFFDKYLKPFFILARDCKNSTKDNCNYTFKELDGTEKSLNSTWARFYLNDGTFIALQTLGSENYKVIYFYVDTNGKRRLNVVGRDIFLFEYWIENNAHPDWVGKLLPFGHEYSRDELISSYNPNNCSNKCNGNYCSSLIMNDNWQIIQGYPWAQARYVVK